MLSLAKWITADSKLGTVSPEFKTDYKLSGKVRSVRAYASAFGIYHFLVNGKRASNALLMPGWTSYTDRIQYQEFDLTSLIDGDSVSFSIMAARGWALGRIGVADWGDGQNREKEEPSVIARIDIEYENGKTETICTDKSWLVYSTHILYSGFYDGETVDFTRPTECFGNAIENDPAPTAALVSQIGEYVVERERVAPIELIITPNGERVIDFGQNIAGYAEIKITGNRGERVTISHAEVLDKYGNFYTANLRSAKNVCSYTLDGNYHVLKPTFAFEGFRYIRLDEFPEGEIDLSSFTAVAIYSDIKRTGYFTCGHSKLNQLYSNIIWGQRGNFIDVPTDCPQRDERLGWTGDAEVFCRTAAINYDVEKFFKKWIGELVLEQTEDGGIRGIVPSKIGGHLCRISTVWADAAVICPWEIYLAYGDVQILRDSYDMMKKWIEYMHNFGDDEFLYVGGNHYGDWLGMDAGEGEYLGATQTDLIASAYFAFSTSLVIKAGKILGEDTTYHENLYKKVRAAFRESFMKDGMPIIYKKADGLTTKRPVSALTQTAISLILRFGLYEECEKEALANKLCELISDFGGRMTTGFVGTPHLLHALSDSGKVKTAFDLLLNERNPSWLFSVNMGATTIWEHWDSINENGDFWSTDMNSFNHYAYGSVYDWIFGDMMGIKICDDGAAYTHITYSPLADERIGFAEASIESRSGKIISSWRYLPSGKVRYEITLPENTLCEVNLPGMKKTELKGGSYTFII